MILICLSGNISHLYDDLNLDGKRCGRTKEAIAMYDILLNQIDYAINGKETNEDNELMKYLVSRLEEDLKRIPEMKEIFQLNPKERNLKLLEILRQKLIAR